MYIRIHTNKHEQGDERALKHTYTHTHKHTHTHTHTHKGERGRGACTDLSPSVY